MKPIYLDYAAATPMDERAIQAMRPYLQEHFFNPSAVYQAARLVKQDIESARAKVANVLGAKDQEIVFTAGGTEANNLAIHGVLQQFPGAHAVVSAIEHESVLEPIKNYSHTVVSVNKKGIVDLEKLESAITEKTVFVSVMYANNEIGTIQPLKEIAGIIKKARAKRSNLPLSTHHYPLFLHTDAAQASNYLDLHVSRIGVDLMSLNGGKIYAPKQSGALYISKNVQLKSQINGGGQENSRRSGTENTASIVAFATMLHNVQAERKAESQRIIKLRDKLYATLSQNINLKFNGDSHKRLANNLNVTIPGVDGERLLMELDEVGIMLATSSACTASNSLPSHVLLALGNSKDEANASLRITLGQSTTLEEVDRATELIIQKVKQHLVN